MAVDIPLTDSVDDAALDDDNLALTLSAEERPDDDMVVPAVPKELCVELGDRGGRTDSDEEVGRGDGYTELLLILTGGGDTIVLLR